ncbi:helix-turn-helix domain-containing protein [Brevundimonas nasdae]|uniref:helix-turn-helix transcriptional regulator n=1 Tax=Brevundimonas nasdae TaxID=172043 RepID=UPI000A01431F
MNRLLCTKEAARLLKVSHRTLEDWRLKGSGPGFVKWGRAVRYRISDLEDFVGPIYRNTAEALHQ